MRVFGFKKGPEKMVFSRDTLTFYDDEPDAAMRKKLQMICDIVNSVYWRKWEITDFKSKGYSKTVRYINEENDVWLLFLGCTDSTHAPEGFMESEWFLFYYKGFAAKLNFEEQNNGSFLLKTANIGINSITKEEFFAVLESKDILIKAYVDTLMCALKMMERNYDYYKI